MNDAVPMTVEGFAAATAVSRETRFKLEEYLRLLRKWQGTVNLVGASTLDDPWRRHFLDSAQLQPLLLESTAGVVDLGSGAGFPGLVLAVMGLPEVHLVESDQRKGAFLRAVSAALGVGVTIHSCRIEALPPLEASAVVARGLAPLAQLLGHALPLLRPKGICLLLKGRQADQELEVAARDWQFEVERFPSRTDPAGVILRMSAIARR